MAKMSRAKAWQLMVKAWGKGAAYRDNRRPSSPADREAAKARRAALSAENPGEGPTLAGFGDDRTVGEYRAALAAHTAQRKGWRERCSKEEVASRYYRFTVGHILRGGLDFFHVKGEGDTWEEALTAAKIV
jgi:hypothetical protein